MTGLALAVCGLVAIPLVLIAAAGLGDHLRADLTRLLGPASSEKEAAASLDTTGRPTQRRPDSLERHAS